MAYTPTNWVTGDTVTATKLNKLEQGVANAGSALIVTSSSVNGIETMNKTVQEIYDALSSGTPVYYSFTYGTLSDYIGYKYLAPIILLYNYNSANVIRVAVQYTTSSSVSSSAKDYYGFAPCIRLFQASGLSDYPKYYAEVRPNNSVAE